MIEYKNKIELAEFLAISEIIADGYFDETGAYAPHYGIMNAYRVFYNVCVTKSPYDETYGHNIINIEELDEIVSDDEFVTKFETCVNSGKQGLTFSAAFNNAMQMVDARKSSIGSAVTMIVDAIQGIADRAKSVMSDENMKHIASIAKDIGNGKITADDIVNAYGKQLEEKAGKISVVPDKKVED